MLKTIAWQRVGSAIVLVHANAPPTPDEWRAYLMENVSARSVLVITDGAGPDARQRQELKQAIADRLALQTTAVVTTSRIARAIVTITGLFGLRVRAFSPEAFKDAVTFIGQADSSETLARVVTALRREVSRRSVVHP